MMPRLKVFSVPKLTTKLSSHTKIGQFNVTLFRNFFQIDNFYGHDLARRFVHAFEDFAETTPSDFLLFEKAALGKEQLLIYWFQVVLDKGLLGAPHKK
uniref:Uncharacterized protein n=1 Tax=Romanomermis culicivorax TaxID=13658 RepID=A0A915JQU1_ROMCU